MCGFKRSMEVLPAILVAGLCFAISQFVFSNYHGPTLPDIMSAIITLVGLVILLRFWKPATIWRFEGEKPTVLTGKGYSFGEVIRAWIPFIILAVMVFFWGLPQFKAFLDGISGSIATKGFAWPMLDGMVSRTVPVVPAETPYAAAGSPRAEPPSCCPASSPCPSCPSTASARPWPASSPRFTSSVSPS